MNREIIEAALALAADRGLPLVPCDINKKPVLTGWTTLEIRSLEQVEQAFANPLATLIGARTGQVSGLLVVDIDPDKGGGEWYRQEYERLACQRIHCTRRNGFHLLYKLPPGVLIRSGANVLAPGVDIRAEGGQIIWWPAHGCNVALDGEPELPPQWLLEALPRRYESGNGQEYQQHRHDGGVDGTVAEGRRNDFLARKAGAMRRAGFNAEEITAALCSLNERRCRPPLPDDEVRGIAASVSRYDAAAEPTPAPRHWIDWAGLAGREPPPRTWLMGEWITTGPMYLGGRGGIGKTLLAQQLGTALALQRRFLDDVTAPRRVLMWACEDDHDELWRRQVAICRWLGIDMAELAGRFTIEPRLGLDNTLFAPVYGTPTWTALRTQLAEQVNDLAADVLIVDNIGQTFGAAENDRHCVTAYVNGMIGLRIGSPFTPIMLGHPSKAIGSEFSGSTAWENAVRMRWYLGPTLPDMAPKDEGEVEIDPNVRYVSKRKANYTAQDWRRLTYQDGVLAPDHIQPGRRFDATARKELAQAIVLKGLRRLMGINMDTTPSANSPDYLPRKIVEMKFHEDHSRQELATALNSLLADGKVIIDNIKGADRHTRKVLRPSGQECGK